MTRRSSKPSGNEAILTEDLLSLSEIVAGHVLKGDLSPNVVDAEDLVPPYDRLVSMCRERQGIDIITETLGWHAVEACSTAAERTEGVRVNWALLLERASLRARVGKRLEPIVNKMARGEDADIAKAFQLLSQIELETKQFTALGSVKPEVDVWMPTGYHPLDHFMGGLPKSCLTILAGPPGVGKTTLMAKILMGLARKGVASAWFSLEMTLAQVVMRIMEIDRKFTKKQKDLIYGTEDEYEVDEVYTSAAQVKVAHPEIQLIAIDFADMMIEGEEKTAKASHIYRTTAKLAKRLGIPVLLVAQLNEHYVGGMPRIHHIRWSRLAEAVARQVLLIYNPDQIWADQGQGNKKSPLPYHEGKGYIIQGKSNFGYKMGGTGAVLIDWHGEKGWGDIGLEWVSLAGV